MEKLARASAGYTACGLIAGAFYREYSRFWRFDTTLVQTQLRSLHTHCFSLGTMFLLIVLALEKNFHLSVQRDYKKFYGLYQSGLGITLLCMLIQGCLVTAGREKNFVVSCVAGLGHTLIGAGFFYFYRTLFAAIKSTPSKSK